MENDMAWYMRYQVNNQMDFGEVYWHYEKMKERLNESGDNDSNLSNQLRDIT